MSILGTLQLKLRPEVDMKFLVLISCIAIAAAERSYNIFGGYKEQGKYVYHYEAFLTPAQLPNYENHIAKLHFNGTVELHFLKNDKVVLLIKEHNIYECLSDPKNMSGVDERYSEFSNKISRPHLRKPVKFVYTNGMVQRVFALPDDPDWSVNMKKGILNMLQIDITGKDTETGLKDMYTKEEATIFGICQTSYSHKFFEIVDARQIRRRIGMNYTKAIDYERCTGLNYDIYNKIVQGKNEDQDTNPLKTTATIKLNITGTENKFKIEGVTAKGVYVLYPFSKQTEGIPTISKQRLRLLSEGASQFEKEYPGVLSKVVPRGKLIMKMPSFHKPEIVPPMSAGDREKKATYLCDAIKRFESLIPRGAPVQSVMLVPEISTVFMQIVNNLRVCDLETLEKVWQKCKETQSRRWLIYSLSLCHTETCMESARTKIESLPDEDVLVFLQGMTFAGKPTRLMVNKMQKICSIQKIAKKQRLVQACWITSSNIAKGFCKTTPVCTSWVETSILQGLQKIVTPDCYNDIESCQPIKDLSVHDVLAIAENLGRPAFLTPLEQIIFHPRMPTNVIMTAVSSCRPIIRIAPKRCQIILLRLFRDFKYDSQTRTLAFSVMMENPHPHLVQLCARQIYVEPSLNIRKYAHDVFTQCSESVLMYNKTIRHTCKSVLKLYSRLYLPSPMTNYRSQHIKLQSLSPTLNIASEAEGSCIANNNSYIPRFSQSRLRTSILGRKFEVLDSQMYMQGIQDYINWWIHTMKQYTAEPTEELINVNKRLDDIDERTSHKPKDPEELIYEARFKLFDKLVSVQNLTINKTSSFIEHLYTHLPQIAETWKQLRQGKTWIWTQPFMPVEVMYTVPSLIGIPLVYNMSSVVMPYARSKLKVETEPDIPSPMAFMMGKKLKTIKVSGVQQLSSLTEVRGTIKYRLPFIEVGAQCRKVMNMSAHLEGIMKYNFETREYNEKIEMPKDMREVFYFTMEAEHYVKTSKEPIRKLQYEVDQFGKVQIINVTRPCEGQCRAEEWYIRTTTGKYLSVENNRIVLKSTPFKFKVLFHGVNRRIISLYVPGKGYVVVSRKSPCLFVKPTSSRGKYFIVDFENLQNTLIKSLVKLTNVPPSWGVPSEREINEMKELNSLFMREQVVMHGEEYIENELLEPEKQHIRLAYLSLSQSVRVCLTPKRENALNFTTERKTNLTELLTRYSYTNRTCIGQPWGINLCLHGYYPIGFIRSPVSVLSTPLKIRGTCRPDKDNKITSIDTDMKFTVKDTQKWTYNIITKLVKGARPVQRINTDITWRKQEYKLKIRVTPSDPMLLRMKKFCYDEHFKPDNYSLKISVDDKLCKQNHVEVDFVAPKQLPRHQMAFRINFNTEGVPSFWRQTFWYLDYLVIRPGLRMSSDYWFPNTTAYQNLSHWNFNETINGTTYLQYLLTSNDTLTYKIIAPSETWVWENIKLNAFIKTFQIGSKHMPIALKLRWTKGQACCHHMNNTFITLDKVVYNYTLTRSCEQILLRSCYKNMTRMMVLARRLGIDKYPLQRIVTTLVDKYEIVFVPRKDMKQLPIITVNRKRIQLQDNKYVILKQGRPCIYIVWEPETMNLALWHVQTGLYVALTRGFMIHTTVNQLYFSKVCGMCGNFNGEQRFEFATPEGKLIRDPQRPRLYDPELKFYEERLFGNSWFIPGTKCARGECSYKREFLKVVHQNKYCLTRLRVPLCQKRCRPVKFEQIKAPIVCVSRNESAQLSSQLTSGKPLSLFTATDHLLPVTLPIKCDCPCKNSEIMDERGVISLPALHPPPGSNDCVTVLHCHDIPEKMFRYKFFKGKDDEFYDDYYKDYDKDHKDSDKDYDKDHKDYEEYDYKKAYKYFHDYFHGLF